MVVEILFKNSHEIEVRHRALLEDRVAENPFLSKTALSMHPD